MIDFTVISSKMVDMRLKDTSKGPRVTGEDYVWWIFSIPMGGASLKEAVDRAIESAGPGYDALMDGVVYSKFYWFFVTAKSGYKVVGTPIKTSELITSLAQKGEDVEKVMEGVLFHSSLGRDNKSAIEIIGVKTISNKK